MNAIPIPMSDEFSIPDLAMDSLPAGEDSHKKYEKWNGVSLSDREIEKNNRLALLKKVNAKIKKEKEMARGEIGTCEVCGKKLKALATSYGKKACATCRSRRLQIKKAPRLTEQDYLEFHEGKLGKEKYAEVDELKAKYEDLENRATILDREKTELSVAYRYLGSFAVGLHDVSDRNDSKRRKLRSLCSSLETAYDQLSSYVESIQKTRNTHPSEEAESPSAEGRIAEQLTTVCEKLAMENQAMSTYIKNLWGPPCASPESLSSAAEEWDDLRHSFSVVQGKNQMLEERNQILEEKFERLSSTAEEGEVLSVKYKKEDLFALALAYVRQDGQAFANILQSMED